MPETGLTSRQLALITKLRSIIAEIGERSGENSSVHLDARALANELEWYFMNRVLKEA